MALKSTKSKSSVAICALSALLLLILCSDAVGQSFQNQEWFKKGLRYYKAKNYRQAILEFYPPYNLDKNPLVGYYLAVSLYKFGQYSDARIVAGMAYEPSVLKRWQLNDLKAILAFTRGRKSIRPETESVKILMTLSGYSGPPGPVETQVEIDKADKDLEKWRQYYTEHAVTDSNTIILLPHEQFSGKE
jgi:tetratricopeptide (TPR) repeat protein